MTFLLIISILVLSYILIKSADHVVIAVRRLSKNSTSIAFAISGIFLAAATSLPELFVGITAALEGAPALSLGNVLGANIANLGLVAGVSALLVGRVNVHSKFIRHEVWVAIVAGILPIVLIYDGNLTRVDGLILLAAYGAYASSFFKQRFNQIAEEFKEESFFHRFFQHINHFDIDKTREWGRLFAAIAILLFSSNLIVEVAKMLAVAAGIPVFLVGLIIVSIGTTLPEMAFSIRSLEDREPTMYFGNILGSIITNSTLIIGLVAVISPVKIVAVSEYSTAVIAFAVVFILFWLFTKTKLWLERWEAGVLLFAYLIFAILEFTVGG